MYNKETKKEILKIYSFKRPENYKRFISGRLYDLRANLIKHQITRNTNY